MTPLRRLLSVLSMVFCALPAGSAEWTVTSTENNGPGTLRQAVSWANITAGADTVLFDPSLAGQPVVLTGAPITITDAVTISGLGVQRTTIRRDDAAPRFRIFDIDDGTAEDIVVSIEHLTITNGHAYCLNTDGCDEAFGGGIRNAEELTLYRVAVRRNTAEYESILPGCCGGEVRGGGIYSSGPLEIRSSTIADNIADCGPEWESLARGGGIYHAGPGFVLVQRSTLSRNIAQSEGWNTWSSGGGVYGGNVTIRNSTLSGNTARAEAVQNADFNSAMGGAVHGGVQIHNSTIVENVATTSGAGVYGTRARGGGLEVPSGGARAVVMVSTIVSGNTADVSGTTAKSGPDVYCLEWDTATDNLVGDPADSGIPISVGGNISADPLLGALGNFDGPTNTHPVLPSSPVIDQGTNVLDLATDQRGLQRVVGRAADIGAFESGSVTSVIFYDGFESGGLTAWSGAP